jgi:hypothetical protein
MNRILEALVDDAAFGCAHGLAREGVGLCPVPGLTESPCGWAMLPESLPREPNP